MKNGIVLLGLTSMAAAPALQAQPAKQVSAAKPNVIIIMCDQLRAEAMGREGTGPETMPFMNQLACEGTWFDKAYTAAPLSGPARVSMITGRFPSATHVRTNHNIGDAYYEKDLFDVARESGYKTALIGKNHTYLTRAKADYWSGEQAGKSPEEVEFDKYMGTLAGDKKTGPAPGTAEVQHPTRLVKNASQWIGGLDGAPFMMWLSIPQPHPPYQVCEPYYSMFPPESLPPMRSSAADRAGKGAQYVQLAEMMQVANPGIADILQRQRSIYYGSMRLIDDQLKRLTDDLKRMGVYDNTVIVFLADHGDYAGEYGLMKKGAGVNDALARIPMQWSGPGIVKSAKPSANLVSMVDVFPTICEIMDAPIPSGVQGRSLWPMLTGQDYPKDEFSSVMVQNGYGGMYYTKEMDSNYHKEGAISKQGNIDCLNTWTQSGSMRMLRDGDWKLVCDMDGNRWMYNMAKDPSEIHNLYGIRKYADIQMKLLEKLTRWDISTGDPLPKPRSRYYFQTNPHNYLFKH